MAGFLTTAFVFASCGSDTPPSGDDAAGDPSSTPTSASTTISESSTTTSSTMPTTLTAELEQACSSEPLDPASDGPGPPTDDVVVVLDREGLRLCLGPALVTDTIVESADVSVLPPSEWTVAPVFTLDGIDQFNAAAAQCSTTSPDLDVCPTNRLAIVDGYTVVSSPVVHASSFERDQILISGNLTEEEARDLAASLVVEGIVLRPVLADLGSE